MHLCLERNFVEPIFEDFLAERKSRGKLVFGFDLDKGVPPLKPLDL